MSWAQEFQLSLIDITQGKFQPAAPPFTMLYPIRCRNAGCEKRARPQFLRGLNLGPDISASDAVLARLIEAEALSEWFIQYVVKVRQR